MLVFHLVCQRELSSEIINHLSITSWDSCYFSKGVQIILMVLKVFKNPFFLTTERASSCTFFKVLITFLKNDNTKAIVWYPMSAILWNARWTTGKRNRFSSRWLFFASICVCGYVAILLSLFLTFPYFDFVNNSKMSVLCLFTLSMLKFQIFLYYKQQRWVDQSIQIGNQDRL